jgi:hypothetical protein
MSPRFVRPYVKSNKNDARDAEAICEAVGRPSMRFVAVKSVAQQDMLALHRVRSLLIREDEREAFAFGFVMELRSIAVSDKRRSSTPLRRICNLLLVVRARLTAASSRGCYAPRRQSNAAQGERRAVTSSLRGSADRVESARIVNHDRVDLL